MTGAVTGTAAIAERGSSRLAFFRCASRIKAKATIAPKPSALTTICIGQERPKLVTAKPPARASNVPSENTSSECRPIASIHG